MYSFRKTAIAETRQLEGTEEARELAIHAPSTASIYAYDKVSMADKDITTKAKRQRSHFLAESEIKDFVRLGCEVDVACIAAFREYIDLYWLQRMTDMMSAHIKLEE
ncbi:hypothetical protein BHYA_0099g00010 [Botrytis hyacinthi]|uniref:Uncharacterized protein n=1 Tax=Botrytis hyacinthi TaxID=278943 RepID=A0A4Z1GPE6_9HELO|nr:hypothetical protein BHYA_0099g00010 [Botrytis hyacinthi]